MTRMQRLGLKSLQEMIKKQEIVVLKSDKSGNFLVVGPGESLAMGAAHIGEDPLLKAGEAESTQILINELTSAWGKILGIGEAWKHSRRFTETTINSTANVPSLSILVKDHKSVGEGELPKSRPVCSSGESMELHLQNLISEVLEPVANNNGGVKAMSSEDMLASIDRLNDHLIKVSNGPNCDPATKKSILNAVLVGAVALFRSLKKDKTSEVVESEFLKAEVEYEGINWMELSVCVEINTTKSEQIKWNVKQYLPRRRKNNGIPPGMHSMLSAEDSSEQWNKTTNGFST